MKTINGHLAVRQTDDELLAAIAYTDPAVYSHGDRIDVKTFSLPYVNGLDTRSIALVAINWFLENAVQNGFHCPGLMVDRDLGPLNLIVTSRKAGCDDLHVYLTSSPYDKDDSVLNPAVARANAARTAIGLPPLSVKDERGTEK